MVTWGHVANKKRQISTSARSCLLNLKWIWLMRMDHHPQWSHDKIVAWWRKKSYIFTFKWLMTTKLDKIIAYGIGSPCTNSHDSFITWLYVVTLYLQFRKSCGHQTWQGSGLWQGTKTQKITSLLVKSSFHSWLFPLLIIIPLILNRATIRLLLLMREKELAVLTFLNLYMNFYKIFGIIW